MRPLLATLVLCSGCTGAAATAAVNTAVGAAVAGVRRANGECYTPCNPGSACNKATGLCDPLPCGGTCDFDQKCEPSPVGERCVPNRPLP